MRIGIQLGIHGYAGRHTMPTPGWDNVQRQVRAAEEAGLDLCTVDDALVAGGLGTHGFWEAASIAGAVDATSTRIGIAHSMMNTPLRPPALMAKTAETLDEISGGRYTLGIGAGNTPEDYLAFGIEADPRYSRAAEAVEIVHDLLRHGSADVAGRHHRVTGVHVPRGPRPDGPPIVIGASGPRMIRLAVRFADGWNGWTPEPQHVDSFRPMVDELDRACEELGRDPATLSRSLDVSLDPRPLLGEQPGGITPHLIHGGTERVTEQLLAFRDELGIDEVRCMLWPDPAPERRPEIIAALAGVAEALHAA